MKKILPIGLLILLIYHTLAYMLVFVGTWWQAEITLSEQIKMYRSVDSIVEFQIPLTDKINGSVLARTTSDDFRYHGHQYTVVSMEVRHDTLYMAGMEVKRHSLLSDSLLAFLNTHITGATKSAQKANQLLKFLLTEYSLTAGTLFRFGAPALHQHVLIHYVSVNRDSLVLPVHSPPPEGRL